MYGLEISPNNSLLVACGDVVMVVVARNATATSDVAAAVGVAATDDVVVVVGAAAVVVVWVQQFWMRPCTSSQSHFVSMAVTQRGNEPSWWDRQTTQIPHSTMGRMVCFQPWC